MISENLRALGQDLKTIESVALIPRVGSTLDLANRVLAECIENELPIPSALILAREQLSGRGRGERSWHSPAGKGIYATLTFTVDREQASLLPLSFAVATARFLNRNWDLDARLKWPNDILVDDLKIAGILISARHHGDHAYVAAGVGINVVHLDDAPERATSVEDVLGESVDLDQASSAFVRFFDTEFDPARTSEEILDDWRSLTVHEDGDPIRCQMGDSIIAGSWSGIDQMGRAILARDGGAEMISAGDLINWK